VKSSESWVGTGLEKRPDGLNELLVSAEDSREWDSSAEKSLSGFKSRISRHGCPELGLNSAANFIERVKQLVSDFSVHGLTRR